LSIYKGKNAVGNNNKLLETLKNRVVVSCQPVVGGPMDSTPIITSLGLAAQSGGAAGLRIEGIESVRSLANACDLPIIGIVKRDLEDSPVRISPLFEDIDALAEAGANVIAYDATQRSRPVSTAALVQRIHECGVLAMADCARLEDGVQAIAEGADALGTTLSGYAYNEVSEDSAPDMALLGGFAQLGAFVIAEGRLKTPQDAAKAMKHGADTVVVGSAITRVEYITTWFSDAVAEAKAKPTRLV
jgi:N-acylglucosamine-6-phosphate 2-epimerase